MVNYKLSLHGEASVTFVKLLLFLCSIRVAVMQDLGLAMQDLGLVMQDLGLVMQDLGLVMQDLD